MRQFAETADYLPCMIIPPGFPVRIESKELGFAPNAREALQVLRGGVPANLHRLIDGIDLRHTGAAIFWTPVAEDEFWALLPESPA